MQHAGEVVFVVDDEEIVAQTLAIILNKMGFKAMAFGDPLRALTAAGGLAPNLLIADVVMPGMTGIELALRFREFHPRCKVLLFSGTAATADLLDRARSQGYDFEVLAKPVHPADLLAKLEN